MTLSTRMGSARNEMGDRWEWYYGKNSEQHTKRVAQRVDNGMLKLHFYAAPKGESPPPGYDLANKWACYRNIWEFTTASKGGVNPKPQRNARTVTF